MTMERTRTTITIDRDLWAKFKAATALERHDMSTVLEELIRAYVREHLPGEE